VNIITYEIVHNYICHLLKENQIDKTFMKIHSLEQETVLSHEITAIMSLLVVPTRALNDYLKSLPMHF